MSLEGYRRKRRFEKTPEPRPEEFAAQGHRPLFVVQLHHASRRHYDVRLQVGDVLKSWACPKGPSYDPEVKRPALEVEDHPVSYAAFEGDIPDGYGAGHVDLFDTGVWSTSGDAEAQLQKGHLRFELFGDRLRGGWHLVRSHRKERQPAWFLIKDKDTFVADIEADDLLDKTMVASTVKAAGRSGGAADVAKKLKQSPRKKAPAKRMRKHASAAKLAAGVKGARARKPSGEFFEPELAVLRESPPVGERWLHEVKWDGHPMDFTATSTKTLRNKKIYMDYLRNGRGATAVASYSLRGRPGAPVAVPLRWEELGKIKGGQSVRHQERPGATEAIAQGSLGEHSQAAADLESCCKDSAKEDEVP